MADLWQIREESFSSNNKQIRSQETVFTTGNGYFCTRGNFEEGYPHTTPATLLYGVFDAVPMAKEELANVPDWTIIQLFVNGERFRLDKGSLLTYERTLNMKTAVVTRQLSWQSDSGVQLGIKSERFASLANEHVGIIRYSVTVDKNPDQEPVALELRASLNTAQGNYNLMHWETIDQGQQEDQLWLTSETYQSKVQLAQVISFHTANTNVQRETIKGDIEPAIRLFAQLNIGETLSAEKVLVMYTSRDEGNPLTNALALHKSLMASNADREAVATSTETIIYEALLTQQKEAWANFWEKADVVLEGDDKAQIGLRYSIYQLRISVRDDDVRYSAAAKGLTGFGYRGHIFHDTEIFMLPFYTYVMPHIARNLLIYRYNLLPGARDKARANGYSGAQYPWESTLDGTEATPPAIVHPETGHVIPVLNGFIELHITSSIAYATWEYWRVSGDDEFLRDYGAEILLSTALFWASRAEKHGEQYEINDVIGPDEWHEHVNNNAHTNYMVQNNLHHAIAAFEWLQKHAPDKAQQLQDQLGLSEELRQHVQDVSEHIHLPIDARTGLIDQFDGFLGLKKLDLSKYKGRKTSYQGILGMEEVQQYQIVKQADTLMMLTMLRQHFDHQIKAVNWDYYYPITDHDYGSSLTPALHAILASELNHPEEAYNMFMKGALVDLENQRGNTPEGIHLACAGAVWQAAIFGIAGLQVSDDGEYSTNPCWPEGWQRLAFSFRLRGKDVYVDLHRS